MPPYIEMRFLGSFKIYFPSYLISEFFPMFRVTARIGLLVLIIQLVFTGYGFKYIFEKFSKFGIKKIYSYLIVLFMFLVSLSEFFIPFKFTDISEIPDVYKYLKEKSLSESKLVIFPRSKINQGYFWSKDYKLELITLEKDHFINSKKILKDDFYNNVAFTCEGLEILRGYGSNYFIYFNKLENDSEIKLEFLNKNLEMIAEFSNITQVDSYGNTFYKVINTGNNFSNQSILFKIVDTKVCQN